MRILTLIVTYNSEKWIRKNLSSIEAGADILVMDNGSSDETVKIIKNEFPHVRLKQNQENLGFAAANNVGFEIAKEENYDWIFLVNHDAWLEEGCLSEMKKVMMNPAYSDFGLLSPVHFSGDGSSYDYGFVRFCEKHLLAEAKSQQTPLVEVKEINGAFMMLSSQCLRAVKGFDPVFFFYGEDIDLSYRAKKYSFNIGVVVNALAYHDRADRKPDFTRSRNLLIANHLVQFKQIRGGFFSAFSKTLYSALYALVKKPANFLLYAGVITYFVKNMKQLKQSYIQYN